MCGQVGRGSHPGLVSTDVDVHRAMVQATAISLFVDGCTCDSAACRCYGTRIAGIYYLEPNHFQEWFDNLARKKELCQDLVAASRNMCIPLGLASSNSMFECLLRHVAIVTAGLLDAIGANPHIQLPMPRHTKAALSYCMKHCKENSAGLQRHATTVAAMASSIVKCKNHMCVHVLFAFIILHCDMMWHPLYAE